MSTVKYYPNGEGTKPVYDIGTIGWEYKQDSVLGQAMSLALSAVRTVNPVLGPIASALYGMVDVNDRGRPKNSKILGICC